MSMDRLNKYIDHKVTAYRDIEYNVSEYTFKSYLDNDDPEAIIRLASKVIEPEIDNPDIEELLDDPDVSQWIDQQNSIGNEVGFCKQHGISGSGLLLAVYLDENGY